MGKVLGFEFRAFTLLGRHATNRAMPSARCQWLMSVILATQEAEIVRIVV
jgi:hypothetical protein